MLEDDGEICGHPNPSLICEGETFQMLHGKFIEFREQLRHFTATSKFAVSSCSYSI